MSLNTKRSINIQLNGKDIKSTSHFTYLESVVTSLKKDIVVRLDKARGSFVKLKNLWKANNISKRTKIKLYNSCILSVPMYGAECWWMT